MYIPPQMDAQPVAVDVSRIQTQRYHSPRREEDELYPMAMNENDKLYPQPSRVPMDESDAHRVNIKEALDDETQGIIKSPSFDI